jgi:phenolic acid decarboxylase
MKTAFLFSGKIYPDAFDIFIEQTKNIDNKFASIWNNENPEYITILINNNFTIIYNDTKEQELYTPQFICIFNGLNFLKENGYEYVLKSRFDIVSCHYNNYIEMLKGVKNSYSEKITVIAGIETSTIFFTDTIVAGKIDEMCKMYSLQSLHDGRYPEKFLIENYSNKTNLTRQDIKDIFHFSLNDCILNNFEFIWYRPMSWKSPTITCPDMRIIGEYCKSDFIWV